MVLSNSNHSDPVLLSPQEPEASAAASSRPALTQQKDTKRRTCIVTRTEHAQDDLIRFVLSPEGMVTLDLHNKLPGRGMYVVPRRPALEEAIRKNPFSRAAKQQASIPPDLLENLIAQLEQRALNTLNIARRSGTLIISADKILAFIKANGALGAYITASGPGTDLYRRIAAQLQPERVVTLFDIERLSKALNIENPVHLALKSGALSNKFMGDIDTLKNLLMIDEKKDETDHG